MARGDPDARSGGPADLERIRRLASDLAAADTGPAGELACALADAVLGIAGRVDALWQLIAAVASAADAPSAADAAAGTIAPASGDEPPPAEFLQALTSARGTGHQGVRLNIAGRPWVAAISNAQPSPDPARAWATLERLAQSAAESGESGDHAGSGDRDQGGR
jgi:hypothetical protein